MSEYSNYSYEYSPRVAQNEVASAAGLLAVGLLSGAAVGIAALFQAIQEKAAELEATRLRPPEALSEAIRSEPLAAAAVAQEMPAFRAFGQSVDQGRLSCTLPDLRRALEAARGRLIAAEANVMRQHLAEALGELGYTLQPARRPQPGQALLRAGKAEGTQVVARLTPETGRLEIDLGGFRGSACHAERNKIGEALRRRGINLTEHVTQRHGRCEGGALVAHVREAAAETGTTAVPLRTKVRA